VGTVGEVDYKIEINPGKVKTYHINILKRYFYLGNEQKDVLCNVDKGKQEAKITNGVGSENQEINQTASMACVLEDEETDEPVAVNDADTLPLYKTVRDSQRCDCKPRTEHRTADTYTRDIE